MNKYVALSVVVLAAWLAFEFNDVYIPEGFENPGGYKTFAFATRSLTFYSKAKAWLRLGSFSSSFRAVHKSMENMVKSPNDNDFKIEESVIAGVPVKVYTNLKSSTKPAPLLVYYHGGGFMLGSSKAYEMFFYELTKNVDLKIISVEYRLAPEYPYPIPTSDCYKVTKYIFEHAKEFEIDVNRTVLGGDSSGGNVVAVMTQTIVNEKLPYAPKLQIMIYPKLQMWTDRLPSISKYLGRSSAFMFTSLYMGFESEHDHNVGEILASNNHTTLVNNRQKLLSYLDLNNIPDKYKSGREYYKNFVQLGEIKVEGGVEASEEVKEKLKRLADPGMSPLFADESTLSQLPKAYMIVLEWDVLKDEGILYSERLRKAGVDTTVAFYENAFHGIFTQSSLFSIASVIQADLIKFIKLNI